MPTFASAADFEAAKGQHVGVSEWHTVTQEQVNLFAEATGDHQWIHVDVEKAAGGPFGGTIAHGFLSLSLLAAFGPEVYTVRGARMAINYGLDRVRFLTPVRVGARVRDSADIVDVVSTDGGVRVTMRHTVEIDGAPKPALVADAIVLFFF
jgi:acyl dehydratase